VASNCWVEPSGTDAVCGLIASDISCAAVTVSTVEPAMFPDVAPMSVVPVPRLVARPVLLMLAVNGVSELQVTVAVRSCVVPSVKVPVAVNCCAVPKAIEGFPGVTAIDTSTAAVTLRVVLPLTEADVAVIVAVPVPTLVASPFWLVTLLMVATLGVSLPHSTLSVTFCVVPSVKVPVAVNWSVVPRGVLGIAGVTAIDTSTAGVTFSVVEPLIDPYVADTLVLPTDTLAAVP
jgi:hypothetical protein